jgi:GT2 family glycosyltransferase
MCEHQDVICAVVVSYNSPEHLTECISSSLSQVNQIIVIDNSSDAGVRERIRELASQERVAFILNERNEGLGHALNQGIRYSLDNGYAWTLLLDQDSMLSDGMIGEMMRSYRNCSKETQATIAAVVPVAYDKDLNEHIPSVITTKTLNRKFCKPSKDAFVHFHITSGTLLKNEIAGKIGFMDERLFIDYIDFD